MKAIHHRSRYIKPLAWLATSLLLTMAAGCSGVDVEEYAETTPEFDIAEYFAGTTSAWGMVQDYSGEVQRRFTVTVTGTVEDDTLTLDEAFTYADGETDRRVWHFTREDEHRWVGTANDVEGDVEARQYGHVFHMNYSLDVEVDGRMLTFTMDDWMYLQPDQRVINRTTMSKLGITLGEITLVFDKSNDAGSDTE